MSDIILKQFVLGALENNNYLLIDQNSNEAVLIDGSGYSDEIEKTLQEYNATLKYLLLTHGHFDHVLGVNDIKKKFGCKVLINKEDENLYTSANSYVAQYGIGNVEIPKVDGYVEDNQVIKLGEHEIKVITTPGHTLGGVCYLVDDMLFSGDTLFYECVGRTDLPGGSFEQLVKNIKEKLFTLDKHIKVYPGHGYTSTIGHEIVNNQFL